MIVDMTSSSITDLSHRRVTWAIVILLLILRIPYIIAIIYLMPIENQNGAAVYEISTYVLTAFLIWREREKLASFHLDLASLAMIVVLRPVQTLILAYWEVETPLIFPGIPSLLIWGTATILVISLWRSHARIPKYSNTFFWVMLGILTGLLVSIADNFISFRSILSNAKPMSAAVLSSTSINLLYHMGFAPINEEPLFRGFLWGLLRQLKWKEGWILIIQTLLFTSAHVYFAEQYPLMFWVLIPLAAILFGLLTMRSRSISAAMLAHGMINGSAYLVAAGICQTVIR